MIHHRRGVRPAQKPKQTQFLSVYKNDQVNAIHMLHNQIWGSGLENIGFVSSFSGGPIVAVFLHGRALRCRLGEGGRALQGGDVECGCPYIIGRRRSRIHHRSCGEYDKILTRIYEYGWGCLRPRLSVLSRIMASPLSVIIIRLYKMCLAGIFYLQAICQHH